VLCFIGSCTLSLRSWGLEDNALIGYLKGNGATLVDYTRYPDGSYNADIRGFNTAIIQPGTCTATDFQSFDTYASTTASDGLATYLLSLPSGTIVTGVTIDSAENSLTANARSALSAIGVSTSAIQSISLRSKLVFVATIGQPTFTRVSYAPRSGDNLVMDVPVPCTYMHVLISTTVCFQSITIVLLNSI